MSNENKNSYPYYALHQDHHTMLSSEGFAFPIVTDHNFINYPFMYNHHQQPPLQNPTEFDQHPSHISFSNCLQGAVEYNTLSTAFDLSCSPSEVAICNDNSNSNNEVVMEAAAGTSTSAAAADNPLTPNSSASFSSQEAGVEEDSSKSKKDLQPKACEEGDGKSKNVYVYFSWCFSVLEIFSLLGKLINS